MNLFSRRSLLVAMPAVILTPGLLMPVKPVRPMLFQFPTASIGLPPPVYPMRRFLSDGGRLYEYVNGINWREIEWGKST